MGFSSRSLGNKIAVKKHVIGPQLAPQKNPQVQTASPSGLECFQPAQFYDANDEKHGEVVSVPILEQGVEPASSNVPTLPVYFKQTLRESHSQHIISFLRVKGCAVRCHWSVKVITSHRSEPLLDQAPKVDQDHLKSLWEQQKMLDIWSWYWYIGCVAVQRKADKGWGKMRKGCNDGARTLQASGQRKQKARATGSFDFQTKLKPWLLACALWLTAPSFTELAVVHYLLFACLLSHFVVLVISYYILLYLVVSCYLWESLFLVFLSLAKQTIPQTASACPHNAAAPEAPTKHWRKHLTHCFHNEKLIWTQKSFQSKSTDYKCCQQFACKSVYEFICCLEVWSTPRKIAMTWERKQHVGSWFLLAHLKLQELGFWLKLAWDVTDDHARLEGDVFMGITSQVHTWKPKIRHVRVLRLSVSKYIVVRYYEMWYMT